MLLRPCADRRQRIWLTRCAVVGVAALTLQLTFTRHSLDDLAHTLVRVADEGHLPELRNVVLAFEPITQSVRCYLSAPLTFRPSSAIDS